MTQRPTTPPRFATGVALVDAALNRLVEFLRIPLACPLLYGVLVEGLVPDFPPDVVTLYHGLGHVPIGWFHVGNAESSNLILISSDTTTITFERGALAGVDTPFALWIF